MKLGPFFIAMPKFMKHYNTYFQREKLISERTNQIGNNRFQKIFYTM